MVDTTHALGHSLAETQRLKNQAAMLRPITERLQGNGDSAYLSSNPERKT